jgi:uncharacterized YccA/Bax inhibitor family protein
MAGLQSNNPVFGRAPSLQPKTFGAPGYPTAGEVEDIYRTPQRLTLDDVVIRTSMLLGIIVVTGALAWVSNASSAAVGAAGIAGFALALVNIFKRQIVPALVLLYAACEGFFLGGISAFFEHRAGYEGLPLQAAVGTAAIFGGVLIAYKNKVLRATPKFTKIVSGAFLGLFALLLLNVVINIFDGSGSGLGLRNGSGLAILFSIAFIAVGSMTFVLDFDQAERLVAQGAPERESWRVAFGLVVGLVWLYLEILRLLSYFRD